MYGKDCYLYNRYRVDDNRLVGEKNKYFYNNESMGIVNQDVEMTPRGDQEPNKDIYTTTPTRMESYKVNPMFHEEKAAIDHYSTGTKGSTSNSAHEVSALIS